MVSLCLSCQTSLNQHLHGFQQKNKVCVERRRCLHTGHTGHTGHLLLLSQLVPRVSSRGQHTPPVPPPGAAQLDPELLLMFPRADDVVEQKNLHMKAATLCYFTCGGHEDKILVVLLPVHACVCARAPKQHTCGEVAQHRRRRRAASPAGGAVARIHQIHFVTC